MLVDTICNRLLTGDFYEHFKDQLSMAIQFDVERMAATASKAIQSDREYIRRYGHQILHAIDSIPKSRTE